MALAKPKMFSTAALFSSAIWAIFSTFLAISWEDKAAGDGRSDHGGDLVISGVAFAGRLIHRPVRVFLDVLDDMAHRFRGLAVHAFDQLVDNLGTVGKRPPS